MRVFNNSRYFRFLQYFKRVEEQVKIERTQNYLGRRMEEPNSETTSCERNVQKFRELFD
jgi:hypothetical protein